MSGCEKCKWLDVPPNKAGRIVVRTNERYRCTVPTPDIPALPSCITQNYGYRPDFSRSYVGRGMGEDCPLFEKRGANAPIL